MQKKSTVQDSSLNAVQVTPAPKACSITDPVVRRAIDLSSVRLRIRMGLFQ